MDYSFLAFAGLSIGFLGSLHCLGMCGPLALSFSGNHNSELKRWQSIGLYNFGRALSYSLMGLALGLIGNQFALAGYQRGLSMGAGVLVLFFLFYTYIYKGRFSIRPLWTKSIQQRLGQLINKPRTGRYYLQVGLLNGWLPCGLVYLALASALATGSILKSGALMFFFGLGTIPLMAALMYAGQYMTTALRVKLMSIVPYFIFIAALILILRGMNLGIPLLSPAIHIGPENATMDCH